MLVARSWKAIVKPSQGIMRSSNTSVIFLRGGPETIYIARSAYRRKLPPSSMVARLLNGRPWEPPLRRLAYHYRATTMLRSTIVTSQPHCFCLLIYYVYIYVHITIEYKRGRPFTFRGENLFHRHILHRGKSSDHVCKTPPLSDAIKRTTTPVTRAHGQKNFVSFSPCTLSHFHFTVCYSPRA